VNINRTDVTTGQIEIAAPVLTIMHIWVDDPPFIPATLIPAIGVPGGLGKGKERGGGGMEGEPSRTKPTGRAKFKTFSGFALYAWEEPSKNLEKSEFKWEFRGVKYVIYSRGKRKFAVPSKLLSQSDFLA